MGEMYVDKICVSMRNQERCIRMHQLRIFWLVRGLSGSIPCDCYVNFKVGSWFGCSFVRFKLSAAFFGFRCGNNDDVQRRKAEHRETWMISESSCHIPSAPCLQSMVCPPAPRLRRLHIYIILYMHIRDGTSTEQNYLINEN